MKSLLLNIFLISTLVLLSAGCKKEKNGSSSSSKEGEIKVSVNFKASSNSSFIYTWGQAEVRLHKDGNLVSTMYASPGSQNLDFGKFNYGKYRIDCFGKMVSTNVNTGKTTTKNISKTKEFTLDSKNKSVDITMSY